MAWIVTVKQYGRILDDSRHLYYSDALIHYELMHNRYTNHSNIEITLTEE